jgi:hypothetical protein
MPRLHLGQHIEQMPLIVPHGGVVIAAWRILQRSVGRGGCGRVRCAKPGRAAFSFFFLFVPHLVRHGADRQLRQQHGRRRSQRGPGHGQVVGDRRHRRGRGRGRGRGALGTDRVEVVVDSDRAHRRKADRACHCLYCRSGGIGWAWRGWRACPQRVHGRRGGRPRRRHRPPLQLQPIPSVRHCCATSCMPWRVPW